MLDPLDPLLITVIELSMATLFASAALSKWAGIATFQAVLADYQVLPRALVGVAARLLPMLEAVLAVAWLAPFDRSPTAVASAGLLTVYAAAMAVNLRRGRRHISCGCGTGDRLSGWLVGRNLVLALGALPTLLPGTGRTQGIADAALAVGAVAVLAILYLAANQLIANGALVTDRNRAAAS